MKAVIPCALAGALGLCVTAQAGDTPGSIVELAQAEAGQNAEAEAQQAEPEQDAAAEPAPPPLRGSGTLYLDNVTLYATRTPKQVLDVPGNVTVITGERIERQMITDMQELMRYEPGIDVNRQTSSTDPFNTFGGFNIRGVGGNRVQMLIDGSRVPERITDGTRDYLDFDFIDQAEIVRGPGSVLWGSDALGGIVALRTVDPEDVLEPGSDFNGRISSSFDSFNNGLDNALTLAMRPNPKVELLAGISYDVSEEGKLSKAHADGGIYGCPRNLSYGATPCNKLDPAEERSLRLLGKAVIRPFDGHRFELSADYLERETEVDFKQVLGPTYNSLGTPTGEIVDGYDRQLDRDRQRFALEHRWQVDTSFLDSLQWTLSYAPQGYERSGTERRTNAAGERVIEDDSLKFSEDFLELDVQATSSFSLLGVGNVLTYGFDGDYAKTNYEREDRLRNLSTGAVTVTRAGGFNFANAETTRADFFVQDEISLFTGRLQLLPGARLAHYRIEPNRDENYQIVPGKEPRKITATDLQFKLGATFHIDDHFSIYGQYAEGFKMPTAEQLYTSLPGTFFDLIPAPDLEPEEVTNYEIGLRGRFSNAAFSVNAFYADYTNFIQSFYNPPGTSDYTFRNLSEVQIYGIEAYGEAVLTDEFSVNGSLTWQQADQVASPGDPETPFNVTPLTAVLGLTYRPDFVKGLRLDAVGTFAQEPTRASDPALFVPGGYAVFDAYLSYDLTERVRLTGAMLNITDERYFQWPFPNTYNRTASDSVARANPIELQTQPGRTFRVGIDVAF